MKAKRGIALKQANPQPILHLNIVPHGRSTHKMAYSSAAPHTAQADVAVVVLEDKQ